MAVPVDERLPPPVVAALRCPVCAAPLTVVARTLRCARGHGFDVARQGHVDLRGPRGSHGPGDDATMVARRLEVLGAGHFDPLIEVLVSVVGARLAAPGLVLDVGAGPGVHLARVLDALPDRFGLAVDVSKPASQRAALAHPRAGAIVADVWHGLPLVDGSVAAVLDVFAPRDAPEFHRVLAREGIAVVVTPEPDHLAGLAGPLGLLVVDPQKSARLEATFSPGFEVAERRTLRWTMHLDRDSATAVAGMGPGGHHLDQAELARRAEALPDRVEVQATVVVSIYRRRTTGSEEPR